MVVGYVKHNLTPMPSTSSECLTESAAVFTNKHMRKECHNFYYFLFILHFICCQTKVD